MTKNIDEVMNKLKELLNELEIIKYKGDEERREIPHNKVNNQMNIRRRIATIC